MILVMQWMSNLSFIDLLMLKFSFAWKYFARSAPPAQFTAPGKCTNLAFSFSSLHSDHVLQPVMTLKGLLNLPECMTYQSTSIYAADIAEARPRCLKFTRRLWLLLAATYSRDERNFILCILYQTSVKQGLRCCYSSVIFWLFKVSRADLV